MGFIIVMLWVSLGKKYSGTEFHNLPFRDSASPQKEKKGKKQSKAKQSKAKQSKGNKRKKKVFAHINRLSRYENPYAITISPFAYASLLEIFGMHSVGID